MINLYPTENIVYITKLSHNEVITKLFESSRYEEFGEGYTNNTFNVKRCINYRNSFLPLIRGRFSESIDGTIVEVRMRPNMFTVIFMLIWFCGVLLGCIFSLQAAMNDRFDVFFLIPFGMALFGIILYYGAFKYESLKSKKDLQQIFEAEIHNNRFRL